MVGFIDSGVGGLNVMLSCYKNLSDDFVFLCDNKNSPYGNKTKSKLLKITIKNIDYLIKHYNVDVIVLACNTLSFSIYNDLNKMYNIKIIPMQLNEQEINKLNKDVLFFATKNTIKNCNLIKNKINENGYKCLYIKDLAKKIDDNLFCLENVEKILKKYLKNKKYKDVKSVVLGCTHFLTIKKQIKDCFDVDCIPKLAYDHNEMILDALKFLKVKIWQKGILKTLFPNGVTIPELYKLYTKILGVSLDRRNFRKKLILSEIITDSNKFVKNKGVRPSKLYYIQ